MSGQNRTPDHAAGPDTPDPDAAGTAEAESVSNAPRTTRRRGEALVRAIVDAAIDAAAEEGVDRLTMEGIARRAGTGKTSLYRRWSSPEDILLDGLYEHFPQEQPSPSADDLRGDLIQALQLMRDRLMADTPVSRVMGRLLAQAERRPDLFKALWERVFNPRGGRFTKTVLWHYAERGQVDPDRLTPVVVDLGEALLMKYGLDHQKYPPDDYIAEIVDQAILPAIGRDLRA